MNYIYVRIIMASSESEDAREPFLEDKATLTLNPIIEVLCDARAEEEAETMQGLGCRFSYIMNGWTCEDKLGGEFANSHKVRSSVSCAARSVSDEYSCGVQVQLIDRLGVSARPVTRSRFRSHPGLHSVPHSDAKPMDVSQLYDIMYTSASNSTKRFSMPGQAS